jgi:hypothetical protein
MGSLPLHAHPEIDDFLTRADEVLDECPEPTTLDPSTGTPSSHPGDQPNGAAGPGPKKSKRRIEQAEGGRAA